jgi:hypothetical protein
MVFNKLQSLAGEGESNQKNHFWIWMLVIIHDIFQAIGK